QKSGAVDGIPTVLEMEMESPDSGCRTAVEYADVHYNSGLNDALFTVAYLSTGKERETEDRDGDRAAGRHEDLRSGRADLPRPRWSVRCDRAGRVRVHRRPQRLRKVHPSQHDGGPRRADHRSGLRQGS